MNHRAPCNVESSWLNSIISFNKYGRFASLNLKLGEGIKEEFIILKCPKYFIHAASFISPARLVV